MNSPNSLLIFILMTLLTRFSEEDDIDISLSVEGDHNTIVIPPMLLMPFVENAFKHAISLNDSSFIHISLVVAPHIQFVVNKL